MTMSLSKITVNGNYSNSWYNILWQQLSSQRVNSSMLLHDPVSFQFLPGIGLKLLQSTYKRIVQRIRMNYTFKRTQPPSSLSISFKENVRVWETLTSHSWTSSVFIKVSSKILSINRQLGHWESLWINFPKISEKLILLYTSTYVIFHYHYLAVCRNITVFSPSAVCATVVLVYTLGIPLARE